MGQSDKTQRVYEILLEQETEESGKAPIYNQLGYMKDNLDKYQEAITFAGINLKTPYFSHGQLYLVCSRVGTGKNLYVLAPNAKTKNIVYQTALQ